MTAEFDYESKGVKESAERDFKEAQVMESKQPGSYWIQFLSRHWSADGQCFEIPDDEVPFEGEYFRDVDLTEAYGSYQFTFKNNLEPRRDFGEGPEGDEAFKGALTYQHARNVHLASYLRSLGWKPEYSWDIEPEVCKEVFPDLYDHLFPPEEH